MTEQNERLLTDAEEDSIAAALDYRRGLRAFRFTMLKAQDTKTSRILLTEVAAWLDDVWNDPIAADQFRKDFGLE